MRVQLTVLAGMLAIVSGCGPEPDTTLASEGSIGDAPAREEPNSCGSPVERDLATFAMFVAEELGRWHVSSDLELDPTIGTIRLSTSGEARCADGCPLARSMLALQHASQATGDRDPSDFRTALVTAWKAQVQVDLVGTPLDDHVLARVGTEPGTCGTMYWYDTRLANCAGDCPYSNADALARRLTFAGYPTNGYLHFQAATNLFGQKGSMVGLDPGDTDNGAGAIDGWGLNGKCVRIRSGGTQRYLDAYTSGDGDVVTRSWQDSTTQRWCLKLVNTNTYTIQHQSFSGQYLDAYITTNDAKAVLRDVRWNTNQHWQLQGGSGSFLVYQFSSWRLLSHLGATDDYRAVTRSSQAMAWQVIDY
jgi:hypothetical protein